MKKKAIALLLGVCMVCSLAACGGESKADNAETAADNKDTAAENTENKKTAERTSLPEVASVDMDIDVEKLVSELCDYSKIPVTITGTYEVTDEQLDAIILSDLTACYANLQEVTDRDTITEYDIANVDFTGYMDGEAFEGGSATGQYVKMGDGNGYIDGFTDDLVGAKIGDEISSDVTFPENYTNNPDLSGKEATFKFKVNGIYETITDMDKIKKLAEDADSIVNTNIKDTYGAYGITDLDSLITYETNYIDSAMSNSKYSDTVAAIKEYMLENCTVEVPEEYLNARVVEYQISFENDNLESDQTLEEYLDENYEGTSVEEAQASWKEYEEKQIKTEFIFSLIARKEGIELDEEEFDSFISNIVSSSSSSTSGVSFADEDAVYEYYGAGVADNGKKYMKELFLMNKAIDFVYEKADVTIEEASEEDTESVDSTEE